VQPQILTPPATPAQSSASGSSSSAQDQNIELIANKNKIRLVIYLI
jgi:hypothetical protein